MKSSRRDTSACKTQQSSVESNLKDRAPQLVIRHPCIDLARRSLPMPECSPHEVWVRRSAGGGELRGRQECTGREHANRPKAEGRSKDHPPPCHNSVSAV